MALADKRAPTSLPTRDLRAYSADDLKQGPLGVLTVRGVSRLVNTQQPTTSALGDSASGSIQLRSRQQTTVDMPKRLTQEQKHAVTAALFRQEPYPDIAAAHGISERRLRGIANCLRTWGTTHPPRIKPMGRPKTITNEIQKGLGNFINARPLASIEDMQSYVQTTFNIKCSYQSVSRRLKDMGYSRTIIQRGNRSLEKNNLPVLSEANKFRIQNDPAAAELLNKPKVLYAWILKPSKPSPKRSKAGVQGNNGQPSDELSGYGGNEESLDGLFDRADSVTDPTPITTPP
ncbi:hypothetical protein GX51_07532 [Blastomyces parvus]|uniref:Insertion element IS150 protein InsJ-like helix-turn-helix domain-containing protein n=1 Tax=Blastomyces parvus TaxID=2060905 RepID=A0A2B7WC05_9EURO|nr:hypothetical protein GX51_07532 [Blastomyces parvus]